MESSTSYSPSSAASSSSSWNEAKLFVGGISGETTEHRLVEYFSKYGEVALANVVENKITGRSRGFAFVGFVDSAAAERALVGTREHVILGRKVEVEKAIPKYYGYQNHQHLHANQYQDQNRELINNITNSHNGFPFNPRKIFVGGLPPNLTEDEFSSFFEQFGEIKDAALMYDNFGCLRGFGFVEFHSVEAVEKVLPNMFHELKDKKVEVKKAVPKIAKNYNKEINSFLSEHMILGSGGGNVFDNDQAGFYPMYDPRYAGLQHYVSPFFLGYASQNSGFAGGYLVGCYDGIGYSSLYASQELVPAWQSLMPYGNTISFSGYMNLPDCRHNATILCSDNSNNGNWNQNSSNMQSQNVDDTMPRPDGDDKTPKSDTDDTASQHDKDGNSAEQLYSYCNGNGKQNLSDMQSQNVDDTKAHPDGDDTTPIPDNDDTAPQHDEDDQLAAQQYSN